MDNKVVCQQQETVNVKVSFGAAVKLGMRIAIGVSLVTFGTQLIAGLLTALLS